MNNKTLMHSSVIAAIIIAAVVGVGLVTGFPAAEQFISVDPLSDKNIGDVFTVTGTTNLPAGTRLLVHIEPVSFEPEGGINGEFSGAAGTVEVIPGTGTRTWSMEVNTSTLNPVKMRVNASVLTGDVTKGDFTTSEPIGIREFTLHPAPGSSGSGQLQGAETNTYIKIDPVAEKTTGDLLIVTGSTNFPTGTILMVQVGSYGIGSGSDTMVRAGTGGVNRYSMPADTSLLKPGTQTITVTNMKGDLEKGDYGLGDVNSTATFTLKGTYRGTDTQVQAPTSKDNTILLDAIGDKKVGDQFLISGTTSLPAGVNLIWEVMPYTGTMPTGLDLNAKGIMANNPVTKGDGTVNRVSLAADMSTMVPGEYIVMVGPMKGDPGNRDIAMGDPIGSTRFILK